jgi:hypothetical protein
MPLNLDPLDLIERDRIASAVIELGRIRAFVGRHGLDVFEGATGVEVDGDPGRPERMAVDPHLEAHRGHVALDHTVGVDVVHGAFGERAGTAHGGAEEGALAAVPYLGGIEIGIQIRFERVMRRHLVALAAFYMQPDPPALAMG